MPTNTVDEQLSALSDADFKNLFGGFSAATLLPLFSGAGTKVVERSFAELARKPLSIFPTAHNHADGASSPARWTLKITNNTSIGTILTRFDLGDNIQGTLSPVSYSRTGFVEENGTAVIPTASGVRCTIDIGPGATVEYNLEAMGIQKEPAFVGATFEFYRLDSDEIVLVKQRLLLPSNIP